MGIYSCGVVKHGNVIFGNGTELCFTGNDYRLRMNPAVLILGLINAILVVSLVCLAVKKGCSCEYSKRVILADFRHVQTVRAQLGDSLSLECSIKLSSQYTLFWFKQTPGEAPQNIVFWSGNLNDDIYYNDRFNQRGRYRVKKRMNSFNLSIISLEITDMGTYYCGVMRQRNILFGNGAEICLTSKDYMRVYLGNC
ncbi:KV5AK protein, partial [Polypterus senegalus]|nr:KV5AK protein [Polypterus senegalus]